ncbi:MAG TPA: TorF family putative porin [Methylophilaceae bacterium]|nr:TorF family putative porin [Methylophilaceae bacterium]
MKVANKPVLLGAVVASAILSMQGAYADDTAVAEKPAAVAPAEPASPHTLTSNVGFFSDYVFRGISYTRERGAIQGGFDYSHSSGIYLGVWASNVNKNALYGNTVELDLYGGYIHQFTPDLSVNVGVLQFFYPDNDKIAGQSPNTTELNAAVTYKWFTLKHSYALTDFFGINTKSFGNTAIGNHVTGTGDSKGSGYTELNFNYKLPVQDINLVLHAGHQTVRNYSVANYTDFLVGVNKDFSVGSSTGWNAGLNYTTTDANDNWYVDTQGYETGDDKVIAYIKRTF